MSEQTRLSLNNIRVHISQIPDFFSRPLKNFLTRQYDFNDEITMQLEQARKAIAALEQQLAAANRQRQKDSATYQKTLVGLESRLNQLEAKNGNVQQ